MSSQPPSRVPFHSLSEEEKAAVREAQKKAKARKASERDTAQQQQKQQQLAQVVNDITDKAADDGPSAPPSRCVVTIDEYFGACQGGRFRDPNLPPTKESLDLLLGALEAGDEQAESLNSCHYFQFSGPEEAVWDATFNARLAWEGFFTITSSTGRRRAIEPLPELQPFYGVLLWDNFERSKHVKKALARLAREKRGYQLSNNAHPLRTWQRIEAYHKDMHSSNWLTRVHAGSNHHPLATLVALPMDSLALRLT